MEHPQDLSDSVRSEPDFDLQISSVVGDVSERVQHIGQFSFDDKQLQETFPDPERREEFLSFATALLKYLPSDERLSFITDPVHFVSAALVFRGLTPDKYSALKATGSYQPQSGHFGSVGVYFSNSPHAAFTFQKEGTIAVVDRDRLLTRNDQGFYSLGSNEYKAYVDDYVARLPDSLTPRERSDALYSADAGLDVIEPVRSDHPLERNIVTRNAQSIWVTKAFLTWNSGKVLEEYPESYS